MVDGGVPQTLLPAQKNNKLLIFFAIAVFVSPQIHWIVYDDDKHEEYFLANTQRSLFGTDLNTRGKTENTKLRPQRLWHNGGGR